MLYSCECSRIIPRYLIVTSDKWSNLSAPFVVLCICSSLLAGEIKYTKANVGMMIVLVLLNFICSHFANSLWHDFSSFSQVGDIVDFILNFNFIL